MRDDRALRHRSKKHGDAQESNVGTPVPAAIVPIEPIGIVQLPHIELVMAYEVVVATYHSSQRTHEAAD